jgi:tetratricopeptide (TPR) repeat protein
MHKSPRDEAWQARQRRAELALLDRAGKEREVFYAVFSPHTVSLPADHTLLPVGVLQRVASETGGSLEPAAPGGYDPWSHYAWESVQGSFFRDYMTREICAFYYFAKGKDSFRKGHTARGIMLLQLASRIGYDDQLIHSELGVFFTNQGLFEAAREELEIATIHHESEHVVYNNWGYFYHKIGEYGKAVESFQKALKLLPRDVGAHNNLGFALYETGREAEALKILKKSIRLDPQQPMVRRFISKHWEAPERTFTPR